MDNFQLGEVDLSNALKNFTNANRPTVILPAAIEQNCSNLNPPYNAYYNFVGENNVCFQKDPSQIINQTVTNANEYRVNFGTLVNFATDNTPRTIVVGFGLEILQGAVDGTKTNRGQLRWDDPNAAGSITLTDDFNFSVASPLLSITKSSVPVSPADAKIGDTITYTVRVANIGTSTAYNVSNLVDSIPTGVGSIAFVSVNYSGGAVPTFSPGTDFDYNSLLNLLTVGIENDIGDPDIRQGEYFEVVYTGVVQGVVFADGQVGPGHNHDTGDAMPFSDGPGCVDTVTNNADVDEYYSGDDSSGQRFTIVHAGQAMVELDSDGDGIPNDVEILFASPCTDSDGDGVPDHMDTDADDNDVPDSVECSTPLACADAEGDGKANFRDLDDDNDGISDFTERTNSLSLDGDDDFDDDGVDDFRDIDSDNDGIPDVAECPVGTACKDSDGDTFPDYLDLDSDGDGISDLVEGHDSDADGVPNTTPSGNDTDNDGLDDAFDANCALPADCGGTIGVVAPTPDSDADGVDDYQDIDSDDDGVVDSTEAHDVNRDGIPEVVAVGTDTDADGIDDAFDANCALPVDCGGTIGAVPAPIDHDGDGIVDPLDTDDDGDGISSRVEANDVNHDGTEDVPFTGADADGDGLDDAFDADCALPASCGGTIGVTAPKPDFDTDGVPDYLDIDADADGIPDLVEGMGDIDGDGRPNYLDLDSDGDGVADATEGHDSNADGAPDVVPSGVDTNGDGVDDAFDATCALPVDCGGVIGVPAPTPDRAAPDTDSVPDYLDLDSDGDGVLDSVEGPADQDGDGMPNYLDLDKDGDGIADSVEAFDANMDGIADVAPVGVDTDGDGLDNAFDPDCAGPFDCGGVIGQPAPRQDTDSDGVADFMDLDSDEDGIPDSVDGTADTDGDGRPNYLDTDSDGDGIPDSTEGHDADFDGTPDATPVGADFDNDGLDNAFDANCALPADCGGVIGVPAATQDRDSDGKPDYLDLDSDADGVLDSVEAHDLDRDGVADVTEVLVDTDNDGLDDAFDSDCALPVDCGTVIGVPAPGPDSNGNGSPNYLDTDDDGDGIPTSIEAHDANADGVADVVASGVDSNNDGLDNAYDPSCVGPMDCGGVIGTPASSPDFDSDGLPDYLDIDSDNDGITDTVEANSDADGDGSPNYLDLDSDQDGILDATEGHDASANGVADVVPVNSDTDNDGLDDAFDANCAIATDCGGVIGVVAPIPDRSAPDADSTPDYLDVDSDGDGITDAVELPAGDTDGDGKPDYLDLDSDDDGINDAVEAHDANADGTPDATPVGTDTDSDGLDDAFDPNCVTPMDCGGTIGIVAPLPDRGAPDTDSLPDYRDTDSDGDGIKDSVEGTVDFDGDGTPNYLDLDSDGDGLLDAVEGHDADADGVADVTPTGTDTNGDGLDDAYDATCALPADCAGTIGVPAPLPDADMDGNDDYLDVDSDGDGIPDSTEGSVDQDGDGTPNYLDTDKDGDGILDNNEEFDRDSNGVVDAVSSGTDTDGDGLDDAYDANCALVTDCGGVIGLAAAGDDFDSDSVPDFMDIDSDGDGVVDNVEGVTDLDGDGMPNYLDPDADGDGIDDAIEAHDLTGDGIADVVAAGNDTDNDGLDDAFDASCALPADCAGVIGVVAPLPDRSAPDADTKPDYLDRDDDGDGIPDAVECAGGPVCPDTDGDLKPDYLDLDSDGDGKSDAIEGHDTDGDFVADQVASGTDTDGDGLDDAFDANCAAAADCGGVIGVVAPVPDLDGDSMPEYQDLLCTASGVVRLPNGEPLPNVSIEDDMGNVVTTTDANGEFEISMLRDGTFDYTAVLANGSEAGTFQVVANDDNCGAAVVVVAQFKLKSPVYFVWNSFYNQVNIPVLQNNGNTPIVVTVTVLDLNATQLAQLTLPIPAHSERDIIINDLPGYRNDVYGYVRVEFPSSASFDGHMAHYRLAPNAFDVEFALIRPFESVQRGRTFAAYNSIQPSFDPSQALNEIPNWMQVVNLHPSAAKTFTVNLYDLDGQRESTQTFTLAPGRRFDVQGGHVVPGLGNIGAAEVVPADPNADYLAQLYTYGADGPVATLAPTFSYAIGEQASPGESVTSYVAISTGGSATNYLVLTNTETSTKSVDVRVRDNVGAVNQLVSLTVPGKGQVHLDVGNVLGANRSGVAIVKPVGGARFIAKSTFYFRNAASQVTTAYSTVARPIFAGAQSGSYNFFLDQFNWLKLFNVTGAATTATIQAFSPSGASLGTRVVNLAANKGTELELNVNLMFGIPEDTVGNFTVTPGTAGSVYAEVLRVKGLSTSPATIDHAASLPAR